MKELREVFEECLEKYRRGSEKYGEFRPETDSRDLLAEAENEILDSLNYLAMHLLKIRALRCGSHRASSRD